MTRPHKAPDSSCGPCISRKVFLILRSASGSCPGQLPDGLDRREKSFAKKKMSVQIFRHRPPFFSFIKRWKSALTRAITPLIPPYNQPNSHISWIDMLLRWERVEETIGTVNAGELNHQFLRLSDFSAVTSSASTKSWPLSSADQKSSLI